LKIYFVGQFIALCPVVILPEKLFVTTKKYVLFCLDIKIM